MAAKQMKFAYEDVFLEKDYPKNWREAKEMHDYLIR
jgi:hypothetical protein